MRCLWLCLWLGLGLAAGCCPAPEQADAPAGVGLAPLAADDVPTAPTPRLETTELWLDLIAQRPSAVMYREDRLWVDLGQLAARKHLALGDLNAWSLAQEVDGRQAGLITGVTGSLDLPLDGGLSPALHPDRDGHPGLALAVTTRSLVGDQAVTVLWNEKVLAHIQLGSTWQRHTFDLPGAHLRPGDNRLRLHCARKPGPDAQGAAAVALVEVGAHRDIVAGPPAEGVGAQVVLRPEGGADLELHPGGALAFYLRPPRRSRLELDVAGQGALEVWVSTDEDHRQGRAATSALQTPLRTTGERHRIDLTAWGDLPLRLELRLRSSRAPGGRGRISRAQVLAKRAIPRDRRPRRGRDVIIVTMEGARADGLEPGPKPALPELEALWAESLVFDRAYALSPAAVPSHAGWMSSVLPPAHLTVRGTFLADRQTLLPEALGRAGYFRLLVTANPDLSPERGLTQGFDEVRVVGGEGLEDHAFAVMQEAQAKLKARTERWFAVLNAVDPQAPYEPPRDRLADATMPPGGPMPHLTHLWVSRVRLGKVVPSPTELAWVRRLYRGELQVVSGAVGQWARFMGDAGRLDDGIVVLVGVHGEEFTEHGGAGHGRTLFEESLRVPLAIHAPALLAPGRVETAVDLLDLAPTLADLLGLAPAEAWQGQSLVPTIDDPEPPPRLVVAYLGDGSKVGVVAAAKLWVGPGSTEHYYALDRDPQEQRDRIADGGIGLRIVRAAMAWHLSYEERWHRARWGTGANLAPAFARDFGM